MLRRLLFHCLAICLACVQLALPGVAQGYPSDAGRYSLKISAPRSLEARLDFEVRADEFQADEWDFFVAQPPALATQTSASVRLTPDGKSYREPAPPERALVRARIEGANSGEHAARVRLEYRVTLSGRELVVREPGQGPSPPTQLSAADRKTFLATNSLYDFRSTGFEKFIAEQNLARQSTEGEVAYARRIFLALKSRLHYEYHATMDRRATHVAGSWSSDCAGMSLLFASLMRAHDVPARVLAGRWAKSSTPGSIVGDVPYYQQHVKAEFYAEGLGWVPVDLSSAVQHDHSLNGLQHFGRDLGNFLTLHIDPLVQVDTLHFGRQTFTWLQGVHYYASGKGSLRNKTIEERWNVRWFDGNQSSLIGGNSSRL
jgi:hypothetical protein